MRKEKLSEWDKKKKTEIKELKEWKLNNTMK